MNKRITTATYIFFDLFSAILSWILFYYFRKIYIEHSDFIVTKNLYLGMLIISIFWLIYYSAMGTYRNVYKRYRMKDIGQTLFVSITGNIVLFFILLLDDEINFVQDYYYLFFALLLLHLTLTIIPRLLITSLIVKKIHRKEIGFSTLIIGGNEKALAIYNEIENIKNSPGYIFKGFISTNGVDKLLLDYPIKYYGDYSNLKTVIDNEKIQEVIIAIESSEHKNIKRIINDLAELDVNIKVIPDMYNILTGMVKMTSIFGALLIEVKTEIMPVWQKTVKRILDVFISVSAIIILFPIYFILIILIKSTSKGSILFKQERIGINASVFNILKFRSMIDGAEINGPQLSSSNDSRITSIGKFMRKSRLDELPQFINVLKGEMSIVGPRPERQYYIDKIMETAPHYKHITKVKPGITSWGQVKYGYAENVDQMVDRLKYDILYIENMSLTLDIKIMFYTIIIIFKGVGK